MPAYVLGASLMANYYLFANLILLYIIAEGLYHHLLIAIVVSQIEC